MRNLSFLSPYRTIVVIVCSTMSSPQIPIYNEALTHSLARSLAVCCLRTRCISSTVQNVSPYLCLLMKCNQSVSGPAFNACFPACLTACSYCLSYRLSAFTSTYLLQYLLVALLLYLLWWQCNLVYRFYVSFFSFCFLLLLQSCLLLLDCVL